MSKIKILAAFMVAVLVSTGGLETAEGQRRVRARGGVRHDVRVVRVHHKVVVRKAHIRYAHLPRWGAVVATVPTAAVLIKTQRNPYYFWNGVYYAPRNGSYVIVRPTPGIRIRALPAGYRRVMVGPRPYYYYYGTFYTKMDNADEYETVEPPAGAIVDSLPEGYEVRRIGDTEYYVLDGIYYAEVDAPEFDDKVGYEVVKV
jgi:hypothetical protein